MPADTEVISRHPGGGGWGDPLERDPQRVLDDVRDGFVSIDAARSEYGVVVAVNGGGGLDAYQLDQSATDSARKTMKAQVRAG